MVMQSQNLFCDLERHTKSALKIGIGLLPMPCKQSSGGKEHVFVNHLCDQTFSSVLRVTLLCEPTELCTDILHAF